jgi:general secretion pathway protein K
VKRERGTAVFMAMLVVAAATTLVAGALWQQNALARETENERALAQARWLLRGAIDWAGVILEEDARTTSVDHRGEPWAVPLADTRLNEDDGRPAAYIAGRIDDEQAKFNLRNLAGPDGIDRSELEMLRRLLALLRIDGSYAERIGERTLAALASGRERADLGRAYAEELLRVGLDRDALERLLPFVTMLPELTSLNVNTAPAELLAARIPGLELVDAKRLVTSRDRAYYKDVADALERLRQVAPKTTDNRIAVTSSYFSIDGTVTYGAARLGARALVRRQAARVELLWLREAV